MARNAPPPHPATLPRAIQPKTLSTSPPHPATLARTAQPKTRPQAPPHPAAGPAVVQPRTSKDSAKQPWEKTGKPFHVWNDKKNNLDIKVWDTSDKVAKKWTLGAYSGKKYMGTIHVEVQPDDIVKPDGLEVAKTEQGAGVGLLLAKYAVQTLFLPAVAKNIPNKATVQVNTVNPISTYVTVKEINDACNGGDTVDKEAEKAGNDIVKEFKGKANGFKVETFPKLWGRMVNLGKEHDATFTSKIGKMDKGQNMKNENAEAFFEWLVGVRITGGNAKGYVFNVELPFPARLKQ